jgi:RNA polymerase sigma factor (sigma-70 family)
VYCPNQHVPVTPKKSSLQHPDALQLLMQEDTAMLRAVYTELLPQVSRFVQANGGSQQDARDVFQDGLVVFLLRLRQSSASDTLWSNWIAYLISICRNCWYRELRDRKIRPGAHGDAYPEGAAPEGRLFGVLSQEEMIAEAVQKAMDAIDPACRDVLKMFYNDRLSMADIADLLGYTPDYIRVKKMRCMDKLRRAIPPGFWNTLNEAYKP